MLDNLSAVAAVFLVATPAAIAFLAGRLAVKNQRMSRELDDLHRRVDRLEKRADGARL